MKSGADLEETDADGFTPFLIAVRWTRLEMVKVNLPPPLPLVWPCADSRLCFCSIQFLLEKPSLEKRWKKASDTTALTNEGDSAHNLAVTHDHEEMVRLLLSKGCSDAPNSLSMKRSTDASKWLETAIMISSAEQGLVSSELVITARIFDACPSSPNFNPPESPLSEEAEAAAAAARGALGAEPEPEPEPEPEAKPPEEGIPPASDDV